MKKILLALFPCLVLSLLFANGATAQEVKKLPEVIVSSTTQSVPISAKLSRHFYADFQNARQPVWDKQGKYFYVYFLTDDMSNRAMYTRRGLMMYQMSYGAEHNLPQDIRHLLRSHYYDYAIKGVTNIKMDRQSVWMANLQDQKKLLVVRVADEGMSLVSNFEKAQ